MDDPVIFLHKPPLEKPALIAGFGGWPNAGDVSTWVLSYLIRSLNALRCAEIRPEPFYDLTDLRPTVSIQEGRVRHINYPSNVFYTVSGEGAPGRDLVLFLGQEPHLNWPLFIDAFMDTARKIGVEEIYTIGGLFDNVPHTIEPQVTGVATHRELLSRAETLGILPANYEGPMSVHTHILVRAGQAGIPCLSLWGHAPYYIQSNNTKTCLVILRRLRDLLGLPLDLSTVEQATEKLDHQIEEVLRSKPELRDYIRSLEEEYRSAGGPPRKEESPSQAKGAHPSDKVIHIDPFLKKG
jgi:proteasome assembly chaperone (PAC2) family protein